MLAGRGTATPAALSIVTARTASRSCARCFGSSLMLVQHGGHDSCVYEITAGFESCLGQPAPVRSLIRVRWKL